MPKRFFGVVCQLICMFPCRWILGIFVAKFKTEQENQQELSTQATIFFISSSLFRLNKKETQIMKNFHKIHEWSLVSYKMKKTGPSKRTLIEDRFIAKQVFFLEAA